MFWILKVCILFFLLVVVGVVVEVVVVVVVVVVDGESVTEVSHRKPVNLDEHL